MEQGGGGGGGIVGELISLTGLPTLSLRKVSTLIGRNQEECDYLISFPFISKVHCEIIVSGGHVFVKDLSSNGLYINGVKIAVKNKTAVLKPGDELSFTPPPKENESDVTQIAFVFRDLSESIKQANTLIAEVSEGEVLEKYDFIRQLGNGAFGIVWLAIHKETKRPCAMKSINKTQFLKKAGSNLEPSQCQALIKRGIFEEVTILHRLKHPHVCGIHDVFDTHSHVLIALELCKGGSLQDLIDKYAPMQESDARALHFQLLQGLAYLHDQNVIHRDLKPENILIKEPVGLRLPIILISDFGLSKILDTRNSRCKTLAGTPFFLAPEVFLPHMYPTKNGIKVGYDLKADLWSVGVILYLMLENRFPFNSKSARIEDEILKCSSSPLVFKNAFVSQDCKNHCSRLLTWKVEERFSAKDALMDEFLNVKKIACSEWDPCQLQRSSTIALSTRSAGVAPNSKRLSEIISTPMEDDDDNGKRQRKL